MLTFRPELPAQLSTGTDTAWMIVVAWEQLCKNGSLSQIELLNDLNVKRSAFVCALLAQFPDVVVVQDRPTVLERITARRRRTRFVRPGTAGREYWRLNRIDDGSLQ
ncbi:hypothetical protein [Mycolicibacterium wolinskyi]|uniref:hypothetical protein n=1 Tax=Mycolicibacterium wolinskyi TaxID=59750 RepID=UPI003917A74D